MALGTGRIKLHNHFLGTYNSVAWGAANLVAGDGLGGIGFTSVNEGSFASTVDEPNGVLAITTDTADNDNAALIAGKFRPVDGTIIFESRFKYSNVDCAIFCGLAETMALDTPVMPAEFATTTMTYNPGGLVGIQYDADGTDDDFRAVMGDGSVAVASSGNGTRANADVTADRYFESRTILYPDGSAEVWFGHSGDVNASNVPNLRLVKRFDVGLNPSDLFYGVLMIENRSGNARVLEVDEITIVGSPKASY
jgi:hypothetical protein